MKVERPQSASEELANSLIHGVALLASIAAVPVLMISAFGERDAWQMTGGAVFGASLILLYLASTTYHVVRREPAKRVLRIIDHSAIYVLIAGTYTPFMLGVLRGPWGWTLLAMIWSLALFGIVAKCTIGFRFPRLSTALYLAMGWLIVIALKPLGTHVPPAGIAWLVTGGLCYTGGVVFYARDSRWRYAHALWHVFVVAGSACHFVAVLRYSA